MKRILICGAGGSPATNFVRSLRLSKEPFFLVGVDADPYTLLRAETDVKLLVPKASDPKYFAALNSIIDEYALEFTHIQNDIEIEILSKHRERLHARLNLPAKETVAVCLDKFASYDRWKRAGLKVPQTSRIDTEADLRKAFKRFGPELWVRDVKGAAGKGSLPVSSVEQAVSWINLQGSWGRCTAAERLSDESVTWMSLWDKGELVVAQSRKRLYWELGNRSPSGVTGVTGAGVTCTDAALDRIALAAIRAVDRTPNGIFSVDLTRDKNGIPNPTEINIGRFFTTHLFFSEAGLNMPELFVKLSYGEPVPSLKKKRNPLPPGLVWIRGVDFEPVLSTMKNVEAHTSKLRERLKRIPRS